MTPSWVQVMFVPVLYTAMNLISGSTHIFDRMDQMKDRFKATFMDGRDTFDFIVVGAGTSGCVVANRLSKHFNVLLLEAGGEQHPGTYIPAASVQMLNKPAIDFYYQTVPQKRSSFAYENRGCSLPAGRGLGGTSFLNFMIYLRGNPLDYDNWANITGDESWSYENVLPHFKAIESYYGEPKDDTHGYQGELSIQLAPYNGLGETFVKAGMEKGFPNADLNGRHTEGFSLCYQNLKHGQRLSSYSAFIAPIRQNNSNLTIYKFSTVQNILFKPDTNEVYGVEYVRHGMRKRAYAKKEVILSAGAFNSAKILMLSGIGPKAHLEELGISTRLNLPVGQGIQDHLTVNVGPIFIDKPLTMVAERDMTKRALVDFFTKHTGVFTSSGTEAIAFLTSSYAKQAGQANWPDIQLILLGTAVYGRFHKDFSNAFATKENILKEYYEGDTRKDSFHIAVSNARPIQRGEIKLQSRDPNDSPLIDPKYLEVDEDVKVMIEGMKRAIDLVENTTTFQDVGARFTSKSFPGCESFEFRSDAYWECYLRHYGLSLHHFISSARMGHPDAQESVVDTQLRVIGAKNLRVIDCSVMPVIPTSNTNAPGFMIGQKGSSMIIDYWKNNGSSII